MRIGHILWNLFGLGIPLLIAALTIPKLLFLIGFERFGFLSLAWGLIGVAGALDLGIGRATTQRISSLRGSQYSHQVPDVIATAQRITLITGAVGMVLILVAAASGAARLIRADSVPTIEIQLSIFLLATALPMQAVSATYRGVNESFLNFKSVSILRAILGVANFGLPYLVAHYSTKVHWLVATLVVSRLLAVVLYRYLAAACARREGHAKLGNYKTAEAHHLLRFGGWFTASSLAAPLLVHSDRFFVGAIISAYAVTLYALPYEIVVQSMVLVGAITTVAFPAISYLLKHKPEQVRPIFRRWLLRVGVLMFAVLSALAYVLPKLLHLWVGSHVSDESVHVGQILCVGVFFNAIGSMYISLLHAEGNTKSTAILHLAEVPLYVMVLILCINRFGIVGCAIAWSLRTMVDAFALAWLSHKSSQQKQRAPYAVV